MNLALLFKQSWPVCLLELLLCQNHLNVARRVVDFDVLVVNLLVKFKLYMVRCPFCLTWAREFQGSRSEGKLEIGLGNIGSYYREVDYVFIGIRGGRALSPGDWKRLRLDIARACLTCFCLTLEFVT